MKSETIHLEKLSNYHEHVWNLECAKDSVCYTRKQNLKMELVQMILFGIYTLVNNLWSQLAFMKKGIIYFSSTIYDILHFIAVNMNRFDWNTNSKCLKLLSKDRWLFM